MNPRDGDAETGPVQARGTVLTVRRVDAYYALTVVAPGISCRQQIEHLAGRRAKHPAEALRDALAP